MDKTQKRTIRPRRPRRNGVETSKRRSFLARSSAFLAGAVLGGCGAAGDDAQAAGGAPGQPPPNARRPAPPASVMTSGKGSADGRLPTTVRLSLDHDLQASSTELVTFGLPLAPGLVKSADQIRVLLRGQPVPISCEPGLRWHWLDGSLRSVSIQCIVDMAKGDALLTIDDAGRDTATNLKRRPIDEGWTDSGFRDADGRVLRKPRVLPLHDIEYLAATGILPPFAPPKTDDDANTGIWLSVKGVLDGAFPWGRTDTGGIDYDSWLFDRPSSLFKLSMQFRDLEKRRALLRNAAISKRHYFAWVRQAQIEGSPQNTVVPFWWDLKRHAVIGPNSSASTYGTTMYQQCQGAKLALALLGDDTQWTAGMLNQWALDMRTKALGTAGIDYSSSGRYVYPQGWTERLASIPALSPSLRVHIASAATVVYAGRAECCVRRSLFSIPAVRCVSSPRSASASLAPWHA